MAANKVSPPMSREEFIGEFSKILHPVTKPIAAGFFENFRRIESLIHMPFVMFSFLEVDDHLFGSFRTRVAEHWSRGMDYATFLQRHFLPTPLVVERDIPDFMERTERRIGETMSNPTYGPLFSSSLQVLYSAAISGSWTAFECVATDLWIAAVNEMPIPLAQAALKSLDLPDSGDLSSKQISVGLAARYGFDLRNCLGTILKSKHDFTSVSGIEKAYRIFARQSRLVDDIFANPILSEMEATRHLIVHRAGKVDEEYKRRVPVPTPVGSTLTFSDSEATKFAGLVEKSGVGLLAFVSDWLVEAGKKNKKEA